MNRLGFSIAVVPILSLYFGLASADDETPYELVEIRDRDGREIYRTAWGRGGRVGFFRDVDADGVQEFVALSESRRDLELSVLELDTDVPRLNFVVGENEAAGLYALNLDDDDQLSLVLLELAAAEQCAQNRHFTQKGKLLDVVGEVILKQAGDGE